MSDQDPWLEVQMVPVTSSNLAAVGYGDGLGLRITFTNGQTYRYAGAPRSLYEGLVSSRSPGGYFHSEVRGRVLGQKE